MSHISVRMWVVQVHWQRAHNWGIKRLEPASAWQTQSSDFKFSFRFRNCRKQAKKKRHFILTASPTLNISHRAKLAKQSSSTANPSDAGSLCASLAGWRSCSLEARHSSWYHQPAFAPQPEDRRQDPAAFHRQQRTAHEKLTRHTLAERLSNAAQVWCHFLSQQEAGQLLLVRFVFCSCCPQKLLCCNVYYFKICHRGFGCGLLLECAQHHRFLTFKKKVLI